MHCVCIISHVSHVLQEPATPKRPRVLAGIEASDHMMVQIDKCMSAPEPLIQKKVMVSREGEG